MDRNVEIKQFIAAIRQALPDAAAKADEIMYERGFDSDENAEYLWMEALADVTNTYIHRRNHGEVKKEFRFFSEQLDLATDAVKNCINVSYVENLMWNLGPEDKKWVWPRIPENLKTLYIAMWGKPDVCPDF